MAPQFSLCKWGWHRYVPCRAEVRHKWIMTHEVLEQPQAAGMVSSQPFFWAEGWGAAAGTAYAQLATSDLPGPFLESPGPLPTSAVPASRAFLCPTCKLFLPCPLCVSEVGGAELRITATEDLTVEILSPSSSRNFVLPLQTSAPLTDIPGVSTRDRYLDVDERTFRASQDLPSPPHLLIPVT